jgi:hypothetical protein
LKALEALRQLRIGGGDQPGQQVRVAAEKLGGAVDDHVDAQIQRRLQQRAS